MNVVYRLVIGFAALWAGVGMGAIWANGYLFVAGVVAWFALVTIGPKRVYA